MSLINQMLQDLDARGSTGAGGLQFDVKPVAREERRVSLPLALGLVGGAAAIAAAGAFGWRYLQKPPARAAVATKPAVVVMRPAPQLLPASQPLAVPAAVDVPASAVDAPFVNAPAAADAPATAVKAPATAVKAPATTDAAPAAGNTPAGANVGWAPVPTRTRKLNATPESPPAAKNSPRTEPVRAASTQKTPPLKLARAVASQPAAAIPAATPPENRPRRGEDAYRRALVSLQDGRITETIAALEQALQLEPRHDAARQTLIGLLVESGRVDEAMRQLQQSLAFDARQPALAMLLARLQIERGASGIETLTRTLPYASGNGEYHAFLGGALQRQGRHTEAAEQYQAALRSTPGNGVWWMGLGISLQADKRNAEALTAFRRAQTGGTLTPELQAFVERKLQQLAR